MFSDCVERLEGRFLLVAPDAEVALPDFGAQVLQEALQVDEILQVGQKEGMLLAHVDHVLRRRKKKMLSQIYSTF